MKRMPRDVVTHELPYFCRLLVPAGQELATKAAVIIGLAQSQDKSMRRGSGHLLDCARIMGEGVRRLQTAERETLASFLRPLIDAAIAGRAVHLPSPLRCPFCNTVLGPRHMCPTNAYSTSSTNSVATVQGGGPGLGKRPRGVRR
jgi:hypothetical protein